MAVVFWFSDAQWTRIEPLLPTASFERHLRVRGGAALCLSGFGRFKQGQLVI